MIGRQGGDSTHVATEVVPPPAHEILGPEQRARAFDFVWDTVAERYHDPKLNGVDWKAVGERYRPRVIEAKDDAAVWENLDRMTGELRDAHTRVDSPERVAMRKRDESVSLGFTFMPLEEKLAITSVST